MFMQNTWLNFICVGLLIVGISSCGGRDDRVGPKSPFKSIDVSQPKDNVLFNLQLACTERSLAWYDELLDADFSFHFSAADMQNGTVQYPYWARYEEINASRNMFDRNYSSPTQDPVSDIHLDLSYAPGDSEWTEILPDDQVKYPGETWYRKTVEYNLTVLAGDWTYTGQYMNAAIVVRPATVGGKQIWRIVEWRDDVNSSFGGIAGSGKAVTEDSTWGRVKAMYAPHEAPSGTGYRSIEVTEPRDNVLINLCKSYTERYLPRYDELLDANFVFHFSPADVQNGNVTFEFWDRPHEYTSATNVFDPNFSSPTQDPVSSISLTLTYPEGDRQWTLIAPEDPVKYPNETWYEKTVGYGLSVQAGDWTYVGFNLMASFVVRPAIVDGKCIWRIVTWRDDASTTLAGFSGSAETRAAVRETTWGQIKAVYWE